MNPYYQFLLPRLLDWSMSDEPFSRYRSELLSQVRGDTLEIGFGTGLNLSYYPSNLRALTAIDANPGMSALAERRIRASEIAVDHQVLNGESLPIDDNRFDSVVSTWTLCSIAKVEQALREIHRVLKPGGRFFFIEHGLSRDRKIQVWQHRLTPIQKALADGCHFDRDIRDLVENQFSQSTIKEFQPENLPAVLRCFYQGIAIKNARD